MHAAFIALQRCLPPFRLNRRICLSEMIGLIFFRTDGVPYEKIWVIAGMNLISHPILWTLCTFVLGFGWGNVIAEIGVVIFERVCLEDKFLNLWLSELHLFLFRIFRPLAGRSMN